MFSATAPAARVRREATWVRSGATRASAPVPPMAWHLTQVRSWKIRAPCAARASVGLGAGEASWACHAPNWAGSSATTRMRIHACCAPQYSAQVPW